MNALFFILRTAIDIYYYVIFFYVILSLLVSFNVINTYNRFVAQVMEILYKICEPALRPIRNFLPNMGGIDLSPLILLIALQALRILIDSDIAPHFIG